MDVRNDQAQNVLTLALFKVTMKLTYYLNAFSRSSVHQKFDPEGLLNFISLLDSPFRKVGWRNSTEGSSLPFSRLLRPWLSAQCITWDRFASASHVHTTVHYKPYMRDRENNLVKTARLSYRSGFRGRDFNWLTSFIL